MTVMCPAVPSRQTPVTTPQERRKIEARLERLAETVGTIRSSSDRPLTDADREEIADIVGRLRFLESSYRNMERR